MKYSNLVDLYSDFLTSSPNIVSALILSKVLGNSYSHDSITRMLAQKELSQQEYWKISKPTVRRIECDDGVISVDDTIEHKAHSDENELIAWHYDHTSGRSVKGINILTFTYINVDMEPSIKVPVAFELVRKDLMKKDKIGKEVRQASVNKNELLRQRLKVLVHQNHIKFRYVCFDTWYSSAENMRFIVKDLEKDFVCAIKDNRSICFDTSVPKKQQKWIQVAQAEIEPNRIYKIRLKEIPFDLILLKKVFDNLNGSIGVQFLVSSDTTLTDEDISKTYQKRWSSEDLHRSLKQNTALEKMPAKMERSQANHIFASMLAQVKLEGFKLATKQNHYSLKRAILIQALKVAWEEIQKLKQLCLNNNIAFPNFSTA